MDGKQDGQRAQREIRRVAGRNQHRLRHDYAGYEKAESRGAKDGVDQRLDEVVQEKRGDALRRENGPRQRIDQQKDGHDDARHESGDVAFSKQGQKTKLYGYAGQTHFPQIRVGLRKIDERLRKIQKKGRANSERHDSDGIHCVFVSTAARTFEKFK